MPYVAVRFDEDEKKKLAQFLIDGFWGDGAFSYHVEGDGEVYAYKNEVHVSVGPFFIVLSRDELHRYLNLMGEQDDLEGH